jgi:hypothetical protein
MVGQEDLELLQRGGDRIAAVARYRLEQLTASASVAASRVTTGAVTISRRATSACGWGPMVSTMRSTLYCW